MASDLRDANGPIPSTDPHTASDAQGAAGSVQEHPPRPDAAASRVVPDAVARRFLRIDDRYFFPDRTLAFVDQGTRLKVRTHNLEVIHSVVAIMQARGWQVVRLKGTEDFRRAVWREATLQGIGVEGFAPTQLERLQVERARERLPIAPGAGSATGAEATPRAPADVARKSGEAAVPREGGRPPVTGELLAHAAAPYRFDPNERMSYYARVRTPTGERTFWGTDLERALAESRSGVKVGDDVVLRQRGARPVTVRVAQRNEAGELVGERRMNAQRMGWTVEKTAFVEALGRQAEVVRQGQLSARAVLAQYPDLAGVMVGLTLAKQFARRLTPRGDDQQRVVEAIRHSLADALARGERIDMPPLRQAHAPEPARARAAPRFEDPERTRA